MENLLSKDYVKYSDQYSNEYKIFIERDMFCYNRITEKNIYFQIKVLIIL